MDNGNHPTIMLSEHERTYIDPGHVNTVSSDQQTRTEMAFDGVTINTDGGINHTTFRQGGFDYNNIYFNFNSNKTTLEGYILATLDDIPLSTIATLENLALDHTNQINSINSNITDLQTLTSTHTSQISALQTSVSNCVTLSQLSTTLNDYALKSEVPSLDGYATQTWVQNQGYATSSEIPTVNNPTITFTQGGVAKGSITLNQSADQTIEFDAGGGGGSSAPYEISNMEIDSTNQTITLTIVANS